MHSNSPKQGTEGKGKGSEKGKEQGKEQGSEKGKEQGSEPEQGSEQGKEQNHSQSQPQPNQQNHSLSHSQSQSQYAQELIRNLKESKLPSELEINKLCMKLMDILILEPNIHRISSPAVVFGDIHGQFNDLLSLLSISGEPDGLKTFIFLGDYVDRGDHSLEVILLLFVYKIQFPNKVILLRGNHEIKNINRIYGFHDEVLLKYGSLHLWNIINEVFSYLSVGCIVDSKYFCIHGGISPRLNLGKLESLDRSGIIRNESVYMDVMWSDPYYKLGASSNPRGSGYLFGEDIAKRFLMQNGLRMIIRSHQLAIEGYKWDFDNLCLTIWSAPDYMGKCYNPASILQIETGVNITNSSIKIYRKNKKAVVEGE